MGQIARPMTRPNIIIRAYQELVKGLEDEQALAQYMDDKVRRRRTSQMRAREQPQNTCCCCDANRMDVVVLEVSYSQQDGKDLQKLASDCILRSNGDVKAVIGVDINYGQESSTVSLWRPNHVEEEGE
ncbi:hypothetical protein B0H63DRAFT_454015 [Podospora didyma]|uniref:Uncharacterized protein n=1 Tax=Podospora didyma TaxID=330526 RepID=A0AAE0K9T4_9PEZI|nr:hypothetical protein B0H63DRAFT_454015 [Podospora didyma]